MLRQQSLKARALKPASKVLKALENEWLPTFLLLADELPTSPPPLYAGVSRRAFDGRRRHLQLDPKEDMEHPFGHVPLQINLGDFLQLNPVKNHTLLEAFCASAVPGVPRKISDEDRDGYRLFRDACTNVVMFKGSHRFLDSDLLELLQIMATPSGRPVPADLKQRVLSRVQAGPDDPRYKLDYVLEGQPGFFAFGAHATIQWEQVTRMMQLRVLQMARLSCGPEALWNTTEGTPDRGCARKSQHPGQLVYYFQAADRFKLASH